MKTEPWTLLAQWVRASPCGCQLEDGETDISRPLVPMNNGKKTHFWTQEGNLIQWNIKTRNPVISVINVFKSYLAGKVCLHTSWWWRVLPVSVSTVRPTSFPCVSGKESVSSDANSCWNSTVVPCCHYLLPLKQGCVASDLYLCSGSEGQTQNSVENLNVA